MILNFPKTNKSGFLRRFIVLLLLKPHSRRGGALASRFAKNVSSDMVDESG
jgi:hypothetical protein